MKTQTVMGVGGEEISERGGNDTEPYNIIS